jgi:hypothetical protein
MGALVVQQQLLLDPAELQLRPLDGLLLLLLVLVALGVVAVSQVRGLAGWVWQRCRTWVLHSAVIFGSPFDLWGNYRRVLGLAVHFH